MSDTYLTQAELAARWRISPRTLERWRWKKTGPSFTKFGLKITYRLDDVVSFERRRRAEIKTPAILGDWR